LMAETVFLWLSPGNNVPWVLVRVFERKPWYCATTQQWKVSSVLYSACDQVFSGWLVCGLVTRVCCLIMYSAVSVCNQFL